MDVAVDPIGYSDALQKAGMPKSQADIIARTQDARLEAFARELATKKDLTDMEARMVKALYNALFGFAAAIAAILAVGLALVR